MQNSGLIIVTGSSAVPLNGEELLFNLYFIPSEFENGQTIVQCSEFELNETIIPQNLDIVISQGLGAKNILIPENIVLGNNYPNPFNANTIISYTQNSSSNVYLYITDLRGVLVKSLFNILF